MKKLIFILSLLITSLFANSQISGYTYKSDSATLVSNETKTSIEGNFEARFSDTAKILTIVNLENRQSWRIVCTDMKFRDTVNIRGTTYICLAYICTANEKEYIFTMILSQKTNIVSSIGIGDESTFTIFYLNPKPIKR